MSKSNQVQILEQCIDAINREFPFKQSLKRQKNRECVTGKLSIAVMRYLAANADAVEKITYNTGANSYRYYAPIGFQALVNKLVMATELERDLAAKAAATSYRTKI